MLNLEKNTCLYLEKSPIDSDLWFASAMHTKHTRDPSQTAVLLLICLAAKQLLQIDI